MTVKEFLKLNNIKRNSDVDFALCAVIGIKRGELEFAQIDSKQIRRFLKIKRKLEKGFPLDLILKNANFYGRNFFINKHVLKPRIDSEAVCEQAIKLIEKNSKVLDLCCGSGILGITIAKEKNCHVTFSDISKKALKVCKINIKKHEVSANVVKGNLFENITEKFDLIVCNPPYIKTDDIKSLEENVKKFDPRIALDGGVDGLDFYKKIIKEAPAFLNKSGKIVFEIGFDQGSAVLSLMKKSFNAILKKDYFGNDRIIIGEKNG